MLRLEAISVEPPLVLAPMAGITDHLYRLMLRRIGGVGLVTMEFISSEAITRGNARQLAKMFFSDEERPLSIQIYGSDPERMSAAAEIVAELAPDVCDINMGCPANKVLKGCAGAALMGDLPLARRIVRDVKRRLSIPLTVKFRLGLDESRKNFLDLGKICEDEGAAAVAMHARTARQMYTGSAVRGEIAQLKKHLAIPVIGNGDVETPGDVVSMLRETGCDGVMIGRATMKNPWIFRQAADLLAGRTPREATDAERRDLMLWHFGRIEATARDPREALHKLRTMTGWYTHGLANGRALRVKISGLATPAAFREAVVEFFAAESAAPELPETRPASGIAFPASESGAGPESRNPDPRQQMPVLL
jgi:tRNA-dihydrouridine synthase B